MQILEAKKDPKPMDLKIYINKLDKEENKLSQNN